MSVHTLSAFVTPTGNHMVLPLRPAQPNPPTPAEATPVSPTRHSQPLAAVAAGAAAVSALAALSYILTTSAGPARALLTLAAFVGLIGVTLFAASTWGGRRTARQIGELVPHLARSAAYAEQSAARQAELDRLVRQLLAELARRPDLTDLARGTNDHQLIRDDRYLAGLADGLAGRTLGEGKVIPINGSGHGR